MGAEGWISVFSDKLPEELVRRAEQAYAFTWSIMTLGSVKYYVLYGDSEHCSCQVDGRTEQELCEELEDYLLDEVTVWT